ncbi:hypothetical protein C8R44DRAFT_878905 [Mycena epipterygia]|nr:hypothetical protein C8R44DRAFT_878905 [Mycena epipterygia]
MTNNHLQATTAPTPQQELAALVAKVAALSKLALDLTRQCIDINQDLPRVVDLQVAAAMAEPPSEVEFVQGVAITPDALDTLFPPGVGDFQPWYVVCIGRELGLYPSSDEADEQVSGVPHQFRRKKSGRAEALSFYRAKHVAGQVAKMTEATGASTSG